MADTERTPTPLREAVVLMDEARLRKMLPFYLDSEELQDALLQAVKLGLPKMAEILLKGGARPDVRTPPRDREAEAAALEPRYVSAEEQAELEASFAEYRRANPRLSDEYVQYTELLVHAFDPDTDDADGGTALIHVCEGTFGLLDPAMMTGTIDYSETQRDSWLERARAVQAQLVDQLIAAGADVNARDTIGRTPLLASGSDDSIGVKLLCSDGYYPLGPLEPLPIIKRLVSAGADVDARDEAGNTILMLMASEEVDAVRVLVDAGASVHLQNRHGYTALMRASSGGNAEVVRLLLARGAAVDPRDKNEFTPLHHAVHHAEPESAREIEGALDTMRALIAAGADVNARGAKGRTPLHLAGGTGCLAEMVHILLDAGAMANVVDELGTTPLDLAVRRGNEHLIPILRRAS